MTAPEPKSGFQAFRSLPFLANGNTGGAYDTMGSVGAESERKVA